MLRLCLCKALREPILGHLTCYPGLALTKVLHTSPPSPREMQTRAPGGELDKDWIWPVGLSACLWHLPLASPGPSYSRTLSSSSFCMSSPVALGCHNSGTLNHPHPDTRMYVQMSGSCPYPHSGPLKEGPSAALGPALRNSLP